MAEWPSLRGHQWAQRRGLRPTKEGGMAELARTSMGAAPRPAPDEGGRMADDTERSVEIERTGLHTFRATNPRGGTLTFGDGGDSEFSPVELLLTAIAG